MNASDANSILKNLYIPLINAFLEHKLNLDELQTQYYEIFKSDSILYNPKETRAYPLPVPDILSAIFLDLDGTDDDLRIHLKPIFSKKN